MSHHGKDPDKLAMYAKLNTYHVDTFAYFLKKLQAIPDGDGTLLDHAVVMYGSGMSDGNVHSNSTSRSLSWAGETRDSRGIGTSGIRRALRWRICR